VIFKYLVIKIAGTKKKKSRFVFLLLANNNTWRIVDERRWMGLPSFYGSDDCSNIMLYQAFVPFLIELDTVIVGSFVDAVKTTKNNYSVFQSLAFQRSKTS
jgi:hypothetical protein